MFQILYTQLHITVVNTVYKYNPKIEFCKSNVAINCILQVLNCPSSKNSPEVLWRPSISRNSTILSISCSVPTFIVSCRLKTKKLSGRHFCTFLTFSGLVFELYTICGVLAPFKFRVLLMNGSGLNWAWTTKGDDATHHCTLHYGWCVHRHLSLPIPPIQILISIWICTHQHTTMIPSSHPLSKLHHDKARPAWTLFVNRCLHQPISQCQLTLLAHSPRSGSSPFIQYPFWLA